MPNDQHGLPDQDIRIRSGECNSLIRRRRLSNTAASTCPKVLVGDARLPCSADAPSKSSNCSALPCITRASTSLAGTCTWLRLKASTTRQRSIASGLAMAALYPELVAPARRPSPHPAPRRRSRQQAGPNAAARAGRGRTLVQHPRKGAAVPAGGGVILGSEVAHIAQTAWSQAHGVRLRTTA